MSALKWPVLLAISFAFAWLWLHVFADIICPGPKRERRQERDRRYDDRHKDD